MGDLKKWNLRTKVIIGFIMAIAAVILAGLISYQSYTDLLQSVSNPTNFDSKIRKLNKVLVDVSEAETSMRAYALTRNDNYLDIYLEFASTIHHDIDSLKIIPPINPNQNIRIDSLAELLDEKISALYAFIESKRKLSNVNFSSKAIKEINTKADSIKTITKSKTTTTTTFDNLAKVAEETASDEKNVKKRRRRKSKAPDPVPLIELQPQVKTETRFVTDTSYIQSDTVLGSITKILTGISDEEKRYQGLVNSKEMAMVEGNSQIIYQIRSLINQLEKEALAESVTNANQAKFITNRSTFTLSLIIIICMIGGIVFISLIFRDIRIGDYYNKQLIGAKKEAEQLAKVKEAFLANMSHEIRTPLNAILGFSEQLTHSNLEEDQRSHLKALISSSEHLLATVNDILDFSKIEAGQMKVGKEPFILEEVIQEVCHNLQVKATEKDIALDYHNHATELQGLLGDPFRLKQVLFNLISNAIKFTDQGQVVISSRIKEEDEEKVRLSIEVKDSGIGISNDHLSEIFKDFKQADISATRRYEGTGLGLAISKRLVEIQNGTISVTSALGEGSNFVVELPYEKCALPEPTKEVKLNSSADALSGKRVLVAEDEDFNIQLLQLILGKWDLNIDLARNGQEALNKIEQNYYDLILTDIQMPELSGVELAQRIRKLEDPKKASTPVIALTANVMKDDLEHYLKVGIDDYLIKPFKEADLWKKLTQLFQLEVAFPSDGIEADPRKEAGTPCNIQALEKFTGGDQLALVEILETFLESNHANTEKLKVWLKQKQWHRIGELAHKMLSSYGHLGADTMVQKLKKLEQFSKSGEKIEEIPNLVHQTILLSDGIQSHLHEKVAEIKSTHYSDQPSSR